MRGNTNTKITRDTKKELLEEYTLSFPDANDTKLFAERQCAVFQKNSFVPFVSFVFF
jgi:hypothetical protein